MIFQSRQVKGHGRGKGLGYPTINLEIPGNFHLDAGVYAVWVEIGDKVYKGALHYGPTPTFDEKKHALEVYLLDVSDPDAPDTYGVPISIDIVSFIRDIEKFENSDALVEQIGKDVDQVRKELE